MTHPKPATGPVAARTTRRWTVRRGFVRAFLAVAAFAVIVVVAALGATPGAAAQTQDAPRDVRVAVRILEPFVLKTPDGTLTGFSIDLWEEIAKRENYRTTYVVTGNVNELIDAVVTGKADVGITAVSITADRQEIVQFSEPMFNGGLQIAVPESRAREVGGVWQALRSPTVIAILVIMVLSVFVAALIVWLVERRDNPDFAHSGIRGVFEGVWWAVVTMLTVGYGDKVTKSIAGRAFSMVFMAFGVLLVACFTAAFTATLTVSGLQTDVSGVADLPGKKVVTVKGTTGAAYLKEHEIPAIEAETVDDMIRQLRNGEVDAAVYDGPVLTYAAKPTSGGRIQLVGGAITREYYGIVEQHGSPLSQGIDVALLTVYEDGTYARLYESWFGST